MNVQEYRCQDCGHSFPSHAPIKDDECPRCGSRKLESNPWLMCSATAAGLTPEDYARIALVGN